MSNIIINSIYAGDNKSYTLSFTDKNNFPVELAGRRIILSIKRDIDDPDSEAIIRKVYNTTGSNLFEFEINLTTEETSLLEGVYEMDIRMSFIGQPLEIQYTPVRAKLTVLKAITNTMEE